VHRSGVVGQGVRHAGVQVQAVADRLWAGVTTSLLGKPWVDERLPTSAGVMGHLGTSASAFLMSSCDTLPIVGSNDPWTEFSPPGAGARRPDRPRHPQPGQPVPGRRRPSRTPRRTWTRCYAAYAELLGLRGIRVDDPADVGAAWDAARAADRPAVLEAVVDAEVPLLPPFPAGEQKLEQMRQGLAQEGPAGERALRLLEEQASQERGLR
jgi:thiamine pyrophosphate-dependent acetolactate synthase large subunit-like protein